MNRKAIFLVLAALLCVALCVSCNQTIHAVVFNANGGQGTMEVQKTTNDSVSLSPNKYYRTGYTFTGWALSSFDPVEYEDKETINIDTDLFLYAKWVPNTYTVKFDANGGSGTMEDEEFTYQTSQTLSKNNFKAPQGKAFVNWKVKGSDKYYMDEEKVWNLSDRDKDVITLEAQWGEGVAYRKKIICWKQSFQTYEYLDCLMERGKVTKLDNTITKLTDGWYSVEENLTYNERISVDGDVHLILFDGTTLTVEKGIDVSNGDKLTIYDQGVQNDAIGKIVATSPDNGLATIGGGTKSDPSGKIYIHGGDLNITAVQGGGAAIGGNSEASNGEIVIYGGTIIATANSPSAAIGSGYFADATLIEIYGGNVTATAASGAGIGAGLGGKNGTIAIGGDAVVVAEGSSSSEASAGIGGANERYGGKIYILGGTVTAKGGIRPEFEYGPKIIGSGIGGGNKDNKGLNGTLEYTSNIIIKVSDDGEKWDNYNGTDRKQYMKSYVAK